MKEKVESIRKSKSPNISLLKFPNERVEECWVKKYEEIMNKNFPELKMYWDPNTGRIHCIYSRTNAKMKLT